MAELYRRSGAARLLDVLLRTAHLGAMAGLCGGLLFDAPSPALRPWLAATAATGLLLLASEATHSHRWVVQGRGLFALGHVVAIALLAWLGASGAGALLALAIGAVGSHLPRSVRLWSFLRLPEGEGGRDPGRPP
jgi:hypothetical protein